MDWNIINGVLRAVLPAVLAYAVGKGWITQSQVGDITAAIITLGAAGWSIKTNVQAGPSSPSNLGGPRINNMAVIAFLIGAGALFGVSHARAADLPNKAPAPLPFVFGPCQQLSCTGIYVGGNIVNEGANFDVLGAGLNGLASNGITLGGEIGAEYWNGKLFAAIEGDLDLSATQNGPGLGLSNHVSERILGKLGYSLSGAFGGGVTGNTPSPTIPAAIVQALMTPYIIVGTEHQPWGWGLSTGAGVQALVARNWTISADYIHTDFNNAAVNKNVREQTDNAFVLHLDFHL